MNQLDRDIAIALLKRLVQRGMISEEEYRKCCNSSCFEMRRFSDGAADGENTHGDDD